MSSDDWDIGSQVEGDEGSKSTRAPREGDAFGPYQLLETLGEGAFGRVFRAQVRGTEREVALKVLIDPGGSRRRLRLQREGELTAALKHPGIVGIHSAGEVEGYPYLAYELVQGGRTLEGVLPVGPPSAAARERAIALVLETCEAVGFAHSQGIVHRDLKPANVLLDSEGRARVADFGLAWAEGVDRLTQSGALLGTPTHLPPERLRGEAGRGGPEVDVYALGVILYRALCGGAPFRATNLAEYVGLVQNTDPRPPSKLAPQVSRAIERVCLRALSRDLGFRFKDAGAMGEALRGAIEGTATGSAVLLWRGPSRRRRALGATLVVFVAALVLLIVATQHTSKPEQLGALRAALETYQRDPSEAAMATLAALASSTEFGAADALLGSAQLELAQDERLSWGARIAYARLARDLVPGRAGFLEGELCLESGRLKEAATAFRQAAEDDALAERERLKAARCLFELEHNVQAVRAASVLLAIRSSLSREVRLGAMALHVQASLRLRRAKDAAITLKTLGDESPADAACLRAEVRSGKDRFAAVAVWREVARAYPRHAAARGGLVNSLLVQGEAEAALEIAAQAPLPTQHGHLAGVVEPEHLVARLRDHTASPPRSTAWTSASLRDQVVAAGAWITRARRDLALADRSERPDVWTHPDALRPSVRRERAGACASAVLELPQTPTPLRALAYGLRYRALGRASDLRAATNLGRTLPEVQALRARAALAAGEAGAAARLLAGLAGRNRAWALLRADALLTQGRAQDCFATLETLMEWPTFGLDPPRDRLSSRAVLAGAKVPTKIAVRSRRVLSPDKQAARVALEEAETLRRSKKATIEELIPAFKKVLGCDPLDLRAHWELAQLRYSATGKVGHILEAFYCADRDPRLLAEVCRDLLHVSGGVSRSRRFSTHAESLSGDSLRERWGRALVGAAAAELEREPKWLAPSLSGLAQLLAQDPGDLVVRAVRTSLLLRTKRLAEAAAELRVLREALPTNPVVTFCELRLRAQRGESTRELRPLMERLEREEYRPLSAHNWTVRLYPELVIHSNQRGFESLLGPLDRK